MKVRDVDIVVRYRQIKDEMIRGFCALTEVVITSVVASVLVVSVTMAELDVPLPLTISTVGTGSSRLNPTIMTITEMITDTATNPSDARPILTNFAFLSTAAVVWREGGGGWLIV